MNVALAPPEGLTRIGRQPIFGRQQQLVGYELLYRDRYDGNAANIVDGDYATSNVLATALLEVGLDRLVGERSAFVNFTKPFLVGDLPMPLECDRVVIEVLESVEIDETLVAGVAKFSEQGYRIALDDFSYSPAWDPLLEFADIVKLDVLSMSEQDVRDHVMLLHDYQITLLAEKVENHEVFELCMELGFDLFQGYYFAKPNLFEQKRASASLDALLQTFAAVNDNRGDADSIAKAVSSDALLSHKLIRYVSSSAFGLRNKVDSVRQAIVYLGGETTRSLATLLLLTAIDDKPPILMKTALIRAMACKGFAEEIDAANPDTYFTAGLMSALDALLDRPLESIVSELPITHELKQAVIHHEGPVGKCLQAILVCERVEAISTLSEYADASRMAYAQAVERVESGEEMASLLPPMRKGVDLDGICYKGRR